MATTQNYSWPSSSDVTLTGTPNGAPIPSTSILVAGENPSGNQEPLQTDASGHLLVAQVPGAIENVNLTEVAGAAISLGQKVSSTSFPIVIASDQSTLPISAASLPLPAGASTSALQTSGNAQLVTIASNQTNGTQVTAINNFPATQPVSGTVTVVQPTGTNLHTVVDSSALPTGAATSANQATEIASLSSIDGKTPALGQALAAASVPVVLTAAQITTLTPLSTVTVTQATGTNLHTVIDSGSVAAATPTAKTVTNAAVTVGTSAVRLTVSGSAPASTRVALVASPDTASTATFYIGNASVTNSGATRGVPIVAGQTFIANNDAGDYYIVASVAAQTVEIMEQS